MFDFDLERPAPKRNAAVPFSFVVDELQPLQPRVTRAFGFVYVYVGDRLVCGLRQSHKQPNTNGVWLYTSLSELESLWRAFPGLSRRALWRSKKDAWIILNARLSNFEELVFKACELILGGDRRIGKPTRGMTQNRER